MTVNELITKLDDLVKKNPKNGELLVLVQQDPTVMDDFDEGDPIPQLVVDLEVVKSALAYDSDGIEVPKLPRSLRLLSRHLDEEDEF